MGKKVIRRRETFAWGRLGLDVLLVGVLVLVWWGALGSFGSDVLFSPEVQSVGISGCQAFNEADQTYFLTKDVVVGNSGRRTCFDVNADNVILDCQGHKIVDVNTVNEKFTAVQFPVRENNFTLKNCVIEGFRTSVRMPTGSNIGSVIDVTFNRIYTPFSCVAGGGVFEQYTFENNVFLNEPHTFGLDGDCPSDWNLPVTFSGERPVVDIASCGEYEDRDNVVYRLTGDLSSSSTCLVVGGDNIKLDCQGHAVRYGGRGIFIVESEGLEVDDCRVLEQPGSSGIGIDLGLFSRNAVVSNSVVQTSGANSMGIRVQSFEGGGVTLRDNQITASGQSARGIYQLGSGLDFFLLEHNVVTANSGATKALDAGSFEATGNTFEGSVSCSGFCTLSGNTLSSFSARNSEGVVFSDQVVGSYSLDVDSLRYSNSFGEIYFSKGTTSSMQYSGNWEHDFALSALALHAQSSHSEKFAMPFEVTFFDVPTGVLSESVYKDGVVCDVCQTSNLADSQTKIIISEAPSGIYTLGLPQIDSDGDGTLDHLDVCPDLSDPDQVDTDGDGIGDLCDPNKDGDIVPNDVDNCPGVANNGQDDVDGDGAGDACDPDSDNDGGDSSGDDGTDDGGVVECDCAEGFVCAEEIGLSPVEESGFWAWLKGLFGFGEEPRFSPESGCVAISGDGSGSEETGDDTEETDVPEGTHVVEVNMMKDSVGYISDDLTIQVGDTVRWVQTETMTHTVTSDDNGDGMMNMGDGALFGSGNMGMNDVYEFTFNEVGEFPYYCDYHLMMGMKGKVTVVEVSEISDVSDVDEGDDDVSDVDERDDDVSDVDEGVVVLTSGDGNLSLDVNQSNESSDAGGSGVVVNISSTVNITVEGEGDVSGEGRLDSSSFPVWVWIFLLFLVLALVAAVFFFLRSP